MSRDLELDAYDRTPAQRFVQKKQKPKLSKRQRRALKAGKLNPFRQKYFDYMQSKAWQIFRQRVFAARSRMCERCGTGAGPLQIHHISYARFGHEELEDVKVLCVPCHKKMHPRH